MTEKRILEITNNISEDMPSGATKAELVECVRFWSRRCSEEVVRRTQLETRLNLVKLALQ